MASQRIDFSINGKYNAKSTLQQASNDIKQFVNQAKSSGTQLGSSMSQGFNKIVSEGRTAIEKLKGFFNSLGGVITSVFSGLTIQNIVQTAAASESKWNRIQAATQASNENIATQKAQIREIADTYGVINGELGGIYETNLRFYGDQQRSLLLTKGIAATSKRTGTDMVTIQQALLSGELGRNKALQRSVLTEAQRNKYLADGKLTQDEINQLMEENIGFVNTNKNLTEDTESAYNRMWTSINKIIVSIGTDLAPILESAANTVKIIGDLFTKVDKATGGLLGGVIGIGLALTALGAPLTYLVSATAKAAASAWSYAAGMRAGAGAAATGGAATTGGAAAGGLGILGTLGAIGVGGLAIAGGAVASWGQGLGHQATDVMSNPTARQNLTGMKPGEGASNIGESWAHLTSRAGNLGGRISQGLQLPGMPGSQGIKWPSAGEIGKWIQDKIPRLNWQWPSWGDIANWIRGKISWLKFPTISWGSVADWIKSKIGWLQFPSISWGSVAQWIQDKIPWLRWPSGPGGFVSGAVSTARNIYNRAHTVVSNVGSAVGGAVSSAVNWVSNAASSAWNWLTGRGPGDVRYEDYAGSRHNPWMSDGTLSGNCVDMSLGLISAAGQGKLVSGTWNGGPHVWANIGGKNYDPARYALEGTWNPPARGPGGTSGNINIFGDVYGFDDFANKVEHAMNKKISRIY